MWSLGSQKKFWEWEDNIGATIAQRPLALGSESLHLLREHKIQEPFCNFSSLNSLQSSLHPKTQLKTFSDPPYPEHIHLGSPQTRKHDIRVDIFLRCSHLSPSSACLEQGPSSLSAIFRVTETFVGDVLSVCTVSDIESSIYSSLLLQSTNSVTHNHPN